MATHHGDTSRQTRKSHGNQSLGKAKWFHVRNTCEFHDRNGTKEVVFIYKATLKKNNQEEYEVDIVGERSVKQPMLQA